MRVHSATGIRRPPSGFAWLAQDLVEILDRAFKPFVELYGRLPVQFAFGKVDVRLALLRVVDRSGLPDQFRAGAGQCDHAFGELDHREIVGIAEVDGTGEVVAGGHQAQDSVYQVADITERACLLPVAEYRDRLVEQ